MRVPLDISTWATCALIKKTKKKQKKKQKKKRKRKKKKKKKTWAPLGQWEKSTLARSVFSRRADLLKHLVRHEHDNMRRTRRHEDRQPSHQTNFGLCSGCLASSKRDRLKKRAPCIRRAC